MSILTCFPSQRKQPCQRPDNKARRPLAVGRAGVGLILIGLSLGPSYALAADGQPDIKPGLWAYRSDMKVYDVDMPSKAFMRCLSAEDIAEKRHLSNQPEGSGCVISNMKEDKGEVSYTFRCKHLRGEMKGSTEGRMSAEGMEFTTEIELNPPVDGLRQFRQTLKAYRVGDCTDPAFRPGASGASTPASPAAPTSTGQP